MNTLLADELRQFVRGIVKQNEPMAHHTTFGVGGPADVYVEPADEEDLAELLKWTHENGIPWMVLGAGANMLVSDSGIRGLVIRMGKPFARVKIEGEKIFCGAGASLDKVVDMAVQAGLAGLEYATAVPGTIGGAILMNAGTYRGWVGDVVETVRVLRVDGHREELSREDMQFSYKHTVLMGDTSRIITSVTFILKPGIKEEMVRTVQQLKRRRNETQPAEGRSAGCMFKNPEGMSAGWMIQEAGLKGMRIGGALVSDKHANFILNIDNASASDLRRLSEEVRKIVEQKFGITLEYEVRLVGDWTGFEEA